MDSEEQKTRLVMVGACAVDTILTVPHFPEPDSKLRATSFSKRRGGNTANSLEVLQQLVHCNNEKSILSRRKTTGLELYLIATLPSRHCAQTEFIASSFNKTLTPDVNLNQCIYREEFTEPVSSYIISDQSTSSRTIINHNALPEMTFDEFIENSKPPLNHTGPLWFHFEGRISDTTFKCIRHIRLHPKFWEDRNRLTISIELEKPGRPGLRALVYYADVIFYSKAWAEGEGYSSAEDCLQNQVRELYKHSRYYRRRSMTLICTWGEQGARALVLEDGRILGGVIQHSPAYKVEDKPIVDTTGAGDTFIAGMLFSFMCRDDLTLRQHLDFANALAGRKILQHGFQGLGEQSLDVSEGVNSNNV